MLHVHRAERADVLVEDLRDLLRQPLEDVMDSEVISVPTRGVERWLTQQLSLGLGARAGRTDGVCANVEFPFPGALLSRATARACGFDPQSDPWPPERSVWPLLELVDRHLDEPFLAPLRRHLETISIDQNHKRRFPVVRRLADLYDRYAVNRPDMLDAWFDGAATWGSGDDTEAWQAELWRRLRTRIGVPGPAERCGEAAERLAADPYLVDLPTRLSVFGLTRLPATHLRILRALGMGRDVHLFLLHPSAALWEKVNEVSPGPSRTMRRVEDATSMVPANPLLRSWGRDAREMQLVLAAHAVGMTTHRPLDESHDTLLGWIQSDVRADRVPGASGDPLPRLADGDRSLQVHSCHGKTRQVEVMRDAIMHLLANDSTLEPRDVLVMCPDIETFAPLIAAAFSTGGASDGSLPRIRVRLADRSIRQTNPLLSVTARLLELAQGRATASEVLDLAACEPVARRFAFDDDSLSRISRWVAESGIRWGIDAPRRAPWHLEQENANTWRFGLDRLLLGAAMSEDPGHMVNGVLPFDDVSGNDVALLGRLAEFVERAGRALDALAGPKTVQEWSTSLAEATTDLALPDRRDDWQQSELHRLLEEVGDEASTSGTVGMQLDLSEVSELLADRLKGRPTRANFRTGDLTVCTLVPMRSVPHRVVGLLGLDDGVFPRQSAHDGDNLLLPDPRVGERDTRSEDRQLLLDALLATGDHLIITYEGHHIRTNLERPPAVPVAELLDVVDATVRLDDPTTRPRQRIVVQHPLQSFDPRNFQADELGEPGPFGFDPVSLEGARVRALPAQPPRPFITGTLPSADLEVVNLEGLRRFVEHPVRSFLRERLSYFAGEEPDEVKEDIPIDLEPLERWGVGDRILTARLEDVALDLACAAEKARGLLPPGQVGDDVLGHVTPDVEALISAAQHRGLLDMPPRSVSVQVRLPSGRMLVGTVAGVRGDAVARIVFSKLAAKHRLAAWVAFLALSAASLERSISAHTLGKDPGPGRVMVAELAPLDPDPKVSAEKATAYLEILVDLYERGLREPLPIYCQTSAAWAKAARAGADARSAANGKWQSSRQSVGEDSDRYHVVVLGVDAQLEALLEESPIAGEDGPGWDTTESCRFGRLARRLWDPVLDHERIVQ